MRKLSCSRSLSAAMRRRCFCKMPHGCARHARVLSARNVYTISYGLTAKAVRTCDDKRSFEKNQRLRNSHSASCSTGSTTASTPMASDTSKSDTGLLRISSGAIDRIRTVSPTKRSTGSRARCKSKGSSRRVRRHATATWSHDSCCSRIVGRCGNTCVCAKPPSIQDPDRGRWRSSLARMRRCDVSTV